MASLTSSSVLPQPFKLVSGKRTLVMERVQYKKP
jgi:hypothetical protein